MVASLPARGRLVVRKRGQGLTVLLRGLGNGATPLGLACFYGALIVLLLAPLYPAISGANFQAILSSSFMSGLLAVCRREACRPHLSCCGRAKSRL